MATTRPGLTRFTLDLDRHLQRRLKVAAALKGVSMREYATQAIERALTEDSVDQADRARRAVDNLIALTKRRDEIFKDRFASDSVEIIRRMREERTRELEQQ